MARRYHRTLERAVSGPVGTLEEERSRVPGFDGARVAPTAQGTRRTAAGAMQACQELSSVSALQLLRGRALEGSQPRPHHLFRDMEGECRGLRVSSRQPSQQLALRNVEEVDLAACAKLPGTRAIVLPLFASPEAEIEHHLHSEGESPARDLPLQRFDEPVPAIVLWLLCILTKETYVPLIGRQPKGRVLALERASQGRLAGTRQPDHQMESCHVWTRGAAEGTWRSAAGPSP